MAVEIVILSGARQGERVHVEGDAFQVGSADAEIVFDPEKDCGIRGRRVALRKEADGWRIRGIGSAPTWLNQQPVQGTMPIRSGDIVRMSETGPDFSFSLVSAADLRTAPAPGLIKPKTQEPPSGASHSDSVPVGAKAFGRSAARWLPAGAALLAVALIVLAVSQLSKDRQNADSPSLPETAPPSVHSGQPLRELNPSPVTEGKPAGPLNRPPVIEPISDQRVNQQNPELLLAVKASDPDAPPGELVFQFGPDRPPGAWIDAATGHFSWRPTREQAGKTFTITVQVAKKGDNSLRSERLFQVHVDSLDPWMLTAEALFECVYLLMTEQPEAHAVYPVGTACAVRGDTLLTSAALAVELEKRRQAGWPVVAAKAAQEGEMMAQKLAIDEIRVHELYVALADHPAKQIFFDLALLKTEQPMPSICRLASPETLTGLEPGRPVACVGIAHEGEPLSRFDKLHSALMRAEVFFVTPYPHAGTPAPGGSPLLIQLQAHLPRNLFGSAIVTDQGEVVGIYAERAELPAEAAPLEIHYAPVPTLASAWLAGQGDQRWVPAKLLASGTEGKKPEQSVRP